MKTFVFLIVLFSVESNNMSAKITCPRCGSLKVPYPFSTDKNCGDPKYSIYCNDGSLEFMSADKNFYYKILSINPNANKLIVSPPTIMKDTCYSSDLGAGGFELDENLPFNISTSNTVLLFNCKENILVSPLNCSLKSFCRQYEAKLDEGNACKDTLCCHFLKDSAMTSHRIRVRLGGCTAYTAVVNLNPSDPADSWNYGIELQWMTPFK